ncbi:YbaK/EbsC family protein [Paenibacillus sp. GYB003]|uniref:YbaK/EbsC family protein n=1 Tax=Paenibacillus sp. GYB003 TaxID=2994392 RepID=UPI002F9676DF
MTTVLKESARRVQALLNEAGYAITVVELPDSARTAKEAADAIGCEAAQIAKSIIFRLAASDKPALVVASGTNRIDERKIAELLGDKPEKADAAFVRERTGYVIGGVAPIGHSEPVVTLIDEDLLRYETLWAAAGHPKAVFALTPRQLIEMTGGQVVAVK